MAASSVDDDDSCLQVANTGPTANWKHTNFTSKSAKSSHVGLHNIFVKPAHFSAVTLG